MKDFRPNKDCKWFIAFAHVFTWVRCSFVSGGLEVKVIGDGLKRFAALKGERTVVAPNHSFRSDPEVMFMFADLVKEDFNFIAAREVFDWQWGWNGLKLQLLGSYSIVRGALDRDSIEWTIGLILKGLKKLVMFPEGEISNQTDTCQPLENGAVALSFKALEKFERALREGENPNAPLPPFNVLPIALKYKFRSSVRLDLLQWLSLLEADLGLTPENGSSMTKRLTAAGTKLIDINEEEYNCSVSKGEVAALEAAYKDKTKEELEKAKLQQRIENIRRSILKAMAAYRSLELPLDKVPLDWTRVIRNHLDNFMPGKKDACAYQQRLHEKLVARLQGYYEDLDRVTTFIAIYAGYVSEHPTEERFEEDIRRMSIEVFGEGPKFGQRVAHIDVGQPINLVDHYAEYKKDKRGTIQKLTADMGTQISDMLKAVDELPPVRLVQ